MNFNESTFQDDAHKMRVIVVMLMMAFIMRAALLSARCKLVVLRAENAYLRTKLWLMQGGE